MRGLSLTVLVRYRSVSLSFGGRCPRVGQRALFTRKVKQDTGQRITLFGGGLAQCTKTPDLGPRAPRRAGHRHTVGTGDWCGVVCFYNIMWHNVAGPCKHTAPPRGATHAAAPYDECSVLPWHLGVELRKRTFFSSSHRAARSRRPPDTESSQHPVSHWPFPRAPAPC